MIKLLPFILIPILLIAGLGYWRYVSIKQSITPANLSQTIIPDQPLEVPKTLPAATVTPPPSPTSTPVPSSNAQLNNIEASITELTARISALEKSTQPTVSSSNSTTYIPLGAGGTWDYTNFTTLSDYQISLDPANFPGYSSVVLEVIFRVVDSTGTTSVRLYNTSDSSVVSSEVSTTSSSFNLASSSSFKLATGSKTYVLQAKNSGGRTFFIQLARLRVNY